MAHPRTLTLLTTAAAAFALALAAAAPAAAHNSIVSSTPQEGETLSVLPELWQVTTNDSLLDLGGEQAGFALVARDAAGAFYGDGCVLVDGATMTAPAALGEGGDYTLVYQLVSADGHTLSGELPFVWQPPADAVPHVGLEAFPTCGETASAPATETAATAEPAPQPSPDATVEIVPIAETPADDSSAVVGIIVASALGIIALITATIALVTRTRSRATGAAEPDEG